MDLLTVVMHELGHLLGYEHSDDPDDLMAPVLPGSQLRASSLFPDPSSLIPHRSSLIADPSFFVTHPSSRLDDVFAELGDDGASQRVASQGGDVLADAAFRPSEEATQAKVPRRSRLQRYERELDDWFAELAAEESGQ